MENEPIVPGAFPPTHWKTIFDASHESRTTGREALSRVLVEYQGPLVRHMMWKFSVSKHDADDLFQSFVQEKILEQRLLRRAEAGQAGMRFRGFLCATIDNFVRDHFRHRNREKRSPVGGFAPIKDALECAIEPTPAAADPLDFAWAKELMERVIEKTRVFYRNKAEGKSWEIFFERVVRQQRDEGDGDEMHELAYRYGFPTAIEASRAVTKVKRKFQAVLRAEVSEYAESEDDVDLEIIELGSILANPPAEEA